MSANFAAQQNSYDLIPELGDQVTFISENNKSTTGRIIYRDNALIRIRPFHTSNQAVDFPLDTDTGLFAAGTSVAEIIIHEKAKFPHFSRQVSVLPGERLEFYSKGGNQVAETATVQSIVATDDEDKIVLQDGRVLDFGFIGPQPPIEVIVSRAAEEEQMQNENEFDVVAEPEEEFFPEIDFSLLPASVVEEIPSSERTYSDSVQREDMFTSLLMDINPAKQKNPRILRNLYRKTDLLLAIKNSVIKRDAAGGIIPDDQRSYIADTLQELMERQPTKESIASIIPVAAINKIIYTDDGIASAVMRDVEVRSDTGTIRNMIQSGIDYEKREKTDFGNPFLSYLDFLLRSTFTASQVQTSETVVDQDVLRSRMPPDPVEGFPSDLPPGVAFRKADYETTFLMRDRLATIEDRSTRLLSASVYKNPKTGQLTQTAPADTGNTIGHIVLSKDISFQRNPTRSSVLLWDIVASEQSRKRTQTFYRMMMNNWENQKVLNEEPISLKEELRNRIAPALNFNSRFLTNAIDSLGLKHMELTEPLLEVLVSAVNTGKKAWDEAYDNMKQMALYALQEKATPIFQIAADGLDPLWSSMVMENPDIRDIIEKINNREKTMNATTTARSAIMTTVANSTLAPLWYLVSSQASSAAIEAATNTYRFERRRIEREIENKRATALLLTAAPIINNCKHVKELESIYKISDDSRRMMMFKKFVANYRAGQSANSIICGSCNLTLVCRHEIMLLNEFENPGRGSAIHKALLLEFSDSVFEGAYICKNCGQKISDLEYDTHLEFIEGEPAVGRTIMDETEEEDVHVMNEEGKAADGIGFSGEDLQNFLAVRTLMEYCGIIADEAMYKRTVESVRDFMKFKLRNKDEYEANRLRAQAFAKRGGPPVPPPYANYEANMKLGAISACIILEILTTDVKIPFASSGCKFVKGGFPLDQSGDGTIMYVACVLAGVIRNDAPWNQVTWSVSSSIPIRQKAAESTVKFALNSILCIPNIQTGLSDAPLTTVTDLYKSKLEEMRENMTREGISDIVGLASRADRVPGQFRPAQVLLKPNSIDSVSNSESFMRNAETKSVDEIGPYIVNRQTQIIQNTISAFHTVSFASAKNENILSEGSPYSEAVCCFQRLGVVNHTGLGYTSLAQAIGEAQTAEILLMESAAATVRKRLPEKSCNGTHIMVPWSAPEYESSIPDIDSSMYYRLFLKHCFRGENMGALHEFDEENICRYCNYLLPEELQWKNLSNESEQSPKKLEQIMERLVIERKEIAMNSFSGQVLIDETSFRALEDAIRLRKTLSNPVTSPVNNLMTVLQELTTHFNDSTLLSSALSDLSILEKTYKSILSKQLQDGPQRRREFGQFSTRYDQMMEAVQSMLASDFTDEQVRDAINGFTTLTDVSLGSQNVRNAMNFFVILFERIGNSFTNEKPKIRKWFPSYSLSHKELLDRIWERQSSIVNLSKKAIAEIESEESQQLIRDCLNKTSSWLGPVLQYWADNVREGAEITGPEIVMIIRHILLHIMASLITDTNLNSLFENSSVHVRRDAIKFFRNLIVDILTSVSSVVKKYQMTTEQIKESLNAQIENEKMYFIKKFDKLDPEMRQIELMKKRLKIGDWAVGTTDNLFKYNKDFYEFRRQQRSEMGLPDFTTDITGIVAQPADNPFGFRAAGGPESGYDMRAVHDED